MWPLIEKFVIFASSALCVVLWACSFFCMDTDWFFFFIGSSAACFLVMVATFMLGVTEGWGE